MFLACRRSYRSRDGPFRGFFCSAQLANGPTAHPPTIAPPPESGAWTCVWRYYYGFLSELGRCTRFRHVLDLEWLPFLVGWVRYNDPLISLSGNPSVTSIDVGACHSAALLFLLSPVPHLLLRYSDFAAFLALKVIKPNDRANSAGDLPSPTLGDDSGGDSDKEDSADDPVGGNQGFVGPSLLTEEALRRMWKKCGFSREIEARIPLKEERPWSAPPGWMSPAAVRNMVIALVLGAEADVDVDAEFFEMISQMNFITDGTFSVSIKARCRLMDGRGPSKADGWQRKYFFVHISPASVFDSSAVFRTEWNPQPVAHGKHWPLPSWGNDLSRGAGPGPSSVVGSSKRKRDASPGRRMGKVKRDIPVYSAVIKGSASGVVPSLSSISSPIVAALTSPVVDTSVSVVNPASVETMGGRKLTPVVDSSHFDVLASSLPAASSCPDVLAGGDSGTVERAASGISKKRKEGGTFTFDDPDTSSVTPEDCARRFSDDLELECRLLVEEKERSSRASWSLKASEESLAKLEVENRELRVEIERLKGDVVEQDCREKELLSQKSALEMEVTRLNESRTESIESKRRRVESVMSARFDDFVEKVRKYSSDRDVVHPQLAENEQALLVQSATLDQMDVHDLELSDLLSFTLDGDLTVD
ncbi:hypothetical protein Bca52824_065686 [Brassica carinata]|uniref:Uncharacterized protein n=1 Tax=Brassica carinata TaxID=52824 RepID=A0A8X7UCM9_BRACI|nr:hypothetical protein Bca52824_065686 [Brassica carinata]